MGVFVKYANPSSFSLVLHITCVYCVNLSRFFACFYVRIMRDDI